VTGVFGFDVPLFLAVGWVVVHSLWQGVLIAMITAGVLGLMRHRSAAARYLVACLGLAAILLLPVATVVWTMISGRQTVTADLVLLLGYLVGATSLGTVAQAVVPLVGVTWLVGASFSLLRATLQWRRARLLVRRGVSRASADIEDALRDLCTRMAVSRPVRVLRSTVATVPMVIGWLRPVILIPVQAATGLTLEQLRAIMAHELAHVARRDYLVNLMQVVIESLMFYHPAVWWLSRRIREEREYACDDLAVAVDRNAVGYARALATLEDTRVSDYRLATLATGGSLLGRIARLVEGTPVRSTLGRALPPLLIMLALALAFLTAEFVPSPRIDALSAQQLRPRSRRSLAPGETLPEGSQPRRRQPAPAPRTATP